MNVVIITIVVNDVRNEIIIINRQLFHVTLHRIVLSAGTLLYDKQFRAIFTRSKLYVFSSKMLYEGNMTFLDTVRWNCKNE